MVQGFKEARIQKLETKSQTGVVEYWSDGLLDDIKKTNIPLFKHSATPLLHYSYVLH